MPAIDMRAGLEWQHRIGTWANTSITGGYDLQKYFNVVEQLAWGPAEAAGSFGESTGDLGIDRFCFRGGLRFNGP
jgi:hypothetical protein